MNQRSDPLSAARQASFEWLCGDDVITPDGGVRAYAEASPLLETQDDRATMGGFEYSEAAALWLSWACWRQTRGEPSPAVAVRRRVAERLLDELRSDNGLGKADRVYLFDSVLGIHALARHLGSRGDGPRREPVVEAARRVLARFRDANAVVLPAVDDIPGTRWSQRWGPYQLRAAGFLSISARLLEEPSLQAEVDWLTRHAASATPAWGDTQEGGGRAARYVHAWAYEGEGRALLGDDPAAGSVADGLAALQRPDGTLPPWAPDGEGHATPARLDATAQALRVWARVNPSAYAPEITRSLDALIRHQGPDGSLPYETGSRHRNTWVTLFADQAIAWAAMARSGDPITEEWL